MTGAIEEGRILKASDVADSSYPDLFLRSGSVQKVDNFKMGGLIETG